MRLTLRTLLSYRDGVLPPKAHEELGQKFRESQTAQGLASRIDRAIAEPKALNLELDEIQQSCSPNEVSEFLDGTMPLDRVFAMERKCISSNAMLAELASIHSILARELLGTSKNPSNQPTGELLAKLYALHDPKDRVEITSPSKSYASTTAQPSADSFGVELQDNPLDLDSSLDYSVGGNENGKSTTRLAFQTALLVLALAALTWLILQDTSVLPAVDFGIPMLGKP